MNKFHCWIAFTSSDITQYMCLAIIWLPGWDVLTFEMYFIFLIKSQGKNLNILRMKKAFKVKKAVFIIFKRLSVAKSVSDNRVRL